MTAALPAHGGGACSKARGVPVGLAVDGANRHDMKLVRATLARLYAIQAA